MVHARTMFLEIGLHDIQIFMAGLPTSSQTEENQGLAMGIFARETLGLGSMVWEYVSKVLLHLFVYVYFKVTFHARKEGQRIQQRVCCMDPSAFGAKRAHLANVMVS